MTARNCHVRTTLCGSRFAAQKRTYSNTWQVQDLLRVNQILKKNISSLFKTAQLEMQRKDKALADARREVELLSAPSLTNKRPRAD
jgi:hypothetical protein